jgi:hypothetical protein
MLSLAFNVIRDYGVLGVCLVQLGIMIYFGSKLFTNHLKHIADHLVRIDEKIDKIEVRCGSHMEKIAKLEGKLE